MVLNRIKKNLFRRVVEPIAPILTKRLIWSYPKQNQIRIALTFDCDLKEDYDALPKLLDLLKKHNIKVSFGCIGKWVEADAKIHKRMLKEGHEIFNHTYSHPDSIWNTDDFSKLSVEKQKEEIKKCNETFKKLLNYTPSGFRTPHFGNLHGQQLYKILENLGFSYSSSTTLRNFKKFNSGKIKEIPVMICPKHYFPLCDTVHCLRKPQPAHSKPGEFFNVFKDVIALARKQPINIVFDWDASDVMNSKDFEDILKYILDAKLKTCILKELI